MAARPPLPPVVDGPITQLSKQVYVDSVLPNAEITVYNDAAGTNQVGAITSTNPGGIWVPLTKPIAVGQQITARQLYTGSDLTIKNLVSGQSDASNAPVRVEAAPNSAAVARFYLGLVDVHGLDLDGRSYSRRDTGGDHLRDDDEIGGRRGDATDAMVSTQAGIACGGEQAGSSAERGRVCIQSGGDKPATRACAG